VPFFATDCARARESVSAQLDGELSELDLDRLEAHLRICPACATWADQVRDVTRQLRAVPLEVPEERLVLSSRRSRRWAVSSAVALASAAAVVATMFIAPRPHRAAVTSGRNVQSPSPAPQVSDGRLLGLETTMFGQSSTDSRVTFRPV
jgi:predicted anti-sigma-YlaC factor YlaD